MGVVDACLRVRSACRSVVAAEKTPASARSHDDRRQRSHRRDRAADAPAPQSADCASGDSAPGCARLLACRLSAPPRPRASRLLGLGARLAVALSGRLRSSAVSAAAAACRARDLRRHPAAPRARAPSGSPPGLRDRRRRAVRVERVERVEQRQRPGAGGLGALQVVARGRASTRGPTAGRAGSRRPGRASRRPPGRPYAARAPSGRRARARARALGNLEHIGERVVRAAALHDQLDDRPLLGGKLVQGGHRSGKG